MSESLVASDEEYLEPGWGPTTPVTDTLTRQAVLVHASWSVTVAAALGRPHRTTDRWAGGFAADHGAFNNFVILLQPLEDPAEVLAEIDGLVPASSPYFLISPWPTPDLRPFGLGRVGHPPLMFRPPGPRPGADRPDVEVTEVHDADSLAVAERIMIDGYPMPELQPARRGSLLDPQVLSDSTRLWLGSVDGEPVAASLAHVAAGVVLVEFVATMPAARGRGVGSAVTWAATRMDPALPAVLVASDDGRPVYEAMGYVAVERWTAWLRPEPGSG